MNRRTFLMSVVAGSVALTTQNRGQIHAQDAMTGSDPMAAAVYLSSLEAQTYVPVLYELYGLMHEDGKEIVPRATLIGWYQEDFQPRGPQVATATGVTWLNEWVWGVTGKVYYNVAEVSYTQYFNDGSVDYEKVRLVYHDNAWRYFFGRDRAWVEQQNHRFSQKDHTPQTDNAPFGLDTLKDLNPGILDRLPKQIHDNQFSTLYVLEENTTLHNTHPLLLPQVGYRYRAESPPSEFGLGSVELGSIIQPGTTAQNMDAIATESQNAPPIEFQGWNTNPERGPAWLLTRMPGVDVVGPSQTLMLVSDATYLRITMFTESSLAMVGASLSGAGGR